MDAMPNLAWYLSISTGHGLSPRCPFASVYRCPRFYQSLSLLGGAGSTEIEPEEDKRLRNEWQKTDIWPTTAEQATTMAGPKDDVKHFWRFCPEVMYDRFGSFAADLHRYSDEIDKHVAHEKLRNEGVLPDDWRWNWVHIDPMHYTECPLYSLLREGKVKQAPMPIFPNTGPPSSVTTRLLLPIEGDGYTANDVEELIEYMYEHPEIATYEFYSQRGNPHLLKAIKEYKIIGDTVEANYYKHPDHELDFINIHKNSAESDWEKHLIATSPMYYKRVIALTDRQRKKLEAQKSQTIWDKIIKHPVIIILAVLGSIASIISILPKNVNPPQTHDQSVAASPKNNVSSEQTAVDQHTRANQSPAVNTEQGNVMITYNMPGNGNHRPNLKIDDMAST